MTFDGKLPFKLTLVLHEVLAVEVALFHAASNYVDDAKILSMSNINVFQVSIGRQNETAFAIFQKVYIIDLIPFKVNIAIFDVQTWF